MKIPRVFPLFALLLAAVRPGVPATRQDCPGCGLALLIPPVELVMLDGVSTLVWEIGYDALGHSIPLSGTFLAGGLGGLSGFMLGGVVAYPFMRSELGALGVGGLLVGLPLGIVVGQGYFLHRQMRFSSGPPVERSPRLGLALAPLPDGALLGLRYLF